MQAVAGFSPLEAGAALLPITVVMLLLAARFGTLAHRIGPRLLMCVGPLVCCCGLILITRLSPHASYARDEVPAVTVFALGLAILWRRLRPRRWGPLPPHTPVLRLG